MKISKINKEFLDLYYKKKLIAYEVYENKVYLTDNPDIKVIADNKPVLIYEKGELVGLILPIKEY